MPRKSRKAKYVMKYSKIVQNRATMSLIRFCIDKQDEIEDEIDASMSPELHKLMISWYLFRQSYRELDSTWEKLFLDEIVMTDDEFLPIFGMDRQCIIQLCNLIKEDTIFK